MSSVIDLKYQMCDAFCNEVFSLALFYLNLSVYCSYNVIFLTVLFLTENSDTRFFEIDRSTGHVLVKRTIPDDELLQPATLVVKVSQDISQHSFIDIVRFITIYYIS